MYVKINKANTEEIARFNAGEITDADSTIHAQAKRVFKAMEDGEEKALAQWTRFRDLSIIKLKEVNAKLNIHFVVYWGESQVSKATMDRAIRICEEKKLTCEDRGALLVDLVKFKMDKAIIRKAGKSFHFRAAALLLWVSFLLSLACCTFDQPYPTSGSAIGAFA